jgi:hypothetical protein
MNEVYNLKSKFLRIDKSLLTTFLHCPNLFKNIIDGKIVIPKEWRMIVGEEFHGKVEEFWRSIIIRDGVLYFPPLKSPSPYLNNIYENFKKMVRRRWELSEGDESKFFPIFVEKKFSTNIKLGEWNLELVGKIDMVDKEEDGSLVVVEWKTGRSSMNYKIELDFYNFLLSNLNYKVSKGVVYYPKYDEVEVFNFDEEGKKNVVKILKTIIFHFENDIWYHNYGCECWKLVNNV